MNARKQLKKMAILTMFGLVIHGGMICPKQAHAEGGSEQTQAAVAKDANVYQGKITGVSKKAKSITISVGKGDQAKMIMVKYDDATKGMEHAKDGEAAIITFEVRGKDSVATDIKPKLATLPAGVKEIQPEELITLIDSAPKPGNFVLVDSRPAKRYDDGHIPGAISIPSDDITTKGAALLLPEKNTPLIFYCGGITCGLSPASAEAAVKMGYTDVKVMLKGAPGWKKAGKMLVASDSFVEKGNIILVDVRSEEEAKSGHIERAVNIPLDTLSDAEGDFPVKAPVVVYGNGGDADKAAAMISKWGLKTVALVEGGLAGYTARGHQLSTAPVETEINWVRQLGKGEVSADEFLTAVKEKSAGSVILDVRTKDETAEGTFDQALTIPLDTLESRISELPKDKELLIHCSTGARAEMAHQILNKNGLKSRFLVADVACTATGKCSVE